MIKLPKWYYANGAKFKIQKKKIDHKGAEFNFDTLEINIAPSEFTTDYRALESLIHEELESTMVGLGLRFSNKPDMPWMFIFDHNDLDSIVGEIARGVLDLIEANKK